MEFRCRLGTPGGEIIEGVYAADSEDRLRREFEEKGLYVLGIQRAGRAALGSLAMPRRSRIATREFLVFNQELATLLKAGMPLVQSLDILRRRVSNPLFKTVLDDVHDRVRAGSALSESFEAHGTLFPGVYTASLLAGEKSGNLEQVIRRYVSYVKVVEGVRRKTISALIYPAVLLALSMIVVGILILQRGAAVQRLLRTVRERAAAVDAHHRVDFELRDHLCRPDRAGADGRRRRVVAVAAAAGQPEALRPRGARAAGGGTDRAEVLDVAGVADAGDAARRRHSAGQRDRRRGAVDQEPLHGRRIARRRRSRCGKAGRWRRR